MAEGPNHAAGRPPSPTRGSEPFEARELLASFGPSALLTPANGLTILRILASPLVFLLVVATGPSSWLLVALWFVLTVSDGFDGYIARRQGTTRSGAFLDPLADKFLILGALAGLAVKGEILWIPVILIALREVGMSAFRSIAGRRGVSIPARRSAKLKTLLQDSAVGLALLPLTSGNAGLVGAVLWIAVVATLVTGYQYLHDGRRLLRAAGQS